MLHPLLNCHTPKAFPPSVNRRFALALHVSVRESVCESVCVVCGVWCVCGVCVVCVWCECVCVCVCEREIEREQEIAIDKDTVP